MGAHPLDRTGLPVAGLVALALLAACTSGGDDPDPAPSPTAASTTAASTTPPAADGSLRVREVARVKAQITRMPEGVRTNGGGPTCIQLERTGGERGETRYQVAVDFTTPAGPAFQGPEGMRVYFDVRVEAGGSGYEGRATFRDVEEADGFLVVEADLLATTGRTTFEPELVAGVQEVPAGLTACHVDVKTVEQGSHGFSGGRRPLRDADLVLTHDAKELEIDDA